MEEKGPKRVSQGAGGPVRPHRHHVWFEADLTSTTLCHFPLSKTVSYRQKAFPCMLTIRMQAGLRDQMEPPPTGILEEWMARLRDRPRSYNMITRENADDLLTLLEWIQDHQACHANNVGDNTEGQGLLLDAHVFRLETIHRKLRAIFRKDVLSELGLLVTIITLTHGPVIFQTFVAYCIAFFIICRIISKCLCVKHICFFLVSLVYHVFFRRLYLVL
jgi:hypothetical protein